MKYLKHYSDIINGDDDKAKKNVDTDINLLFDLTPYNILSKPKNLELLLRIKNYDLDYLKIFLEPLISKEDLNIYIDLVKNRFFNQDTHDKVPSDILEFLKIFQIDIEKELEGDKIKYIERKKISRILTLIQSIYMGKSLNNKYNQNENPKTGLYMIYIIK